MGDTRRDQIEANIAGLHVLDAGFPGTFRAIRGSGEVSTYLDFARGVEGGDTKDFDNADTDLFFYCLDRCMAGRDVAVSAAGQHRLLVLSAPRLFREEVRDRMARETRSRPDYDGLRTMCLVAMKGRREQLEREGRAPTGRLASVAPPSRPSPVAATPGSAESSPDTGASEGPMGGAGGFLLTLGVVVVVIVAIVLSFG